MPTTTFNSAGCPISDLQSGLAELKKFAQRNVELVPDTMELLTDTELTQTWSLDYNDPGYWQMKVISSVCTLTFQLIHMEVNEAI